MRNVTVMGSGFAGDESVLSLHAGIHGWIDKLPKIIVNFNITHILCYTKKRGGVYIIYKYRFFSPAAGSMLNNKGECITIGYGLMGDIS